VAGGGAGVTLAEVLEAATELDHRANASLNRCMDAAGYPELREAAGMAQQRDRKGARSPLAADPLEAGPYTEDMARRYGILGTAELFHGDEPGYVVSRDAGYDRAIGRCQASFDEAHHIDTAALLGRVGQLSNDVHVQFLTSIDPVIGPLLTERLDCVRAHGFPTLTNDISVASDDLLRSVGIASGRFTDEPLATIPARHHDNVSIEPPDAIRTYAPSPSEVEFALAYVRCGNDQGFVTAWNSAQVGPREEIEASEMGTLQTLARSLRKALS